MNFPICIITLLIATVHPKELFHSQGDLNIALILENTNNITTETEQTLINSAIWSIQRLNFLKIVSGLSFGLAIHKPSTSKDLYKTIFELFYKNDDEFVLGSVNNYKLETKIKIFSRVLGMESKHSVTNVRPLIEASVAVLNWLNWKRNVTVVVPERKFVEVFSEATQEEICVKDFLVYDAEFTMDLEDLDGPLVIFGVHPFLQSLEISKIKNSIIAPLDGSFLNDLPMNSYIILPPHSPLIQPKTINILPTPLLFDIATPIISYAESARILLEENCNETSNKLNCLRHGWIRKQNKDFQTPNEIINFLKIEPLLSSFIYHIFKMENQTEPFVKTFTYEIFTKNLTLLEANPEEPAENSTELHCNLELKECQAECKNFAKKNLGLYHGSIGLRAQPWIYAFLSVATLGLIACISILIFLVVSICRRDILEGNPVMTILLLISIMLLYCSILPLTFEGSDKTTDDAICLARSFSLTLSFAATFSLLLSRSILLATASREIGFMSHIAGPVQSFLCLFIFGVQAALNLHIVGHCSEIFNGFAFIYVLSYNIMLLLLLLCLAPLIAKSQRNYREGKYFAIASVVTALTWAFWVPSYGLLDREVQDPALCFGLVSTASIMLGAIFVPRTYRMTVSAARDKITSSLHSFVPVSSAMDIYRAGTQPVYDCVNVAAINAAAVASATTIQGPDLYTCPYLPDDEDYDDVRCDTPISSDKVTRF